jgi:hypothetical protein
MSRYRTTILFLILLAIGSGYAVAQVEVIHPPGGGEPVEGLPILMEFGGTGSTDDAFTDGECVEVFTDVDGLKKLRSAGDACGVGGGAYPTPTVVLTATPTVTATTTPVACPTGAGGALGGLYQAHPELCAAIPATNTPQPTQTPHDCGAGNAQRGHDATPICVVLPTPDGAGAGAPAAGTYIDVSGSTVSFDAEEVVSDTWGDGNESTQIWSHLTSGGTCDVEFAGATMKVNLCALSAISGGTIEATDLACTNCIGGTEIDESALGAVPTASDLVCTNCISTTELDETGLGVLAGANTWTGDNSFEGLLEVAGAGATLPVFVLEDDTGTDAVQFDPTSNGVFAATGSGTVRANDVVCTGCVTTTDVASLDISDDTNLAAGTGATLTGDTLSVDLGTSIDISSETNLTASGGVTLTGDALTADLGTSIDISSETNLSASGGVTLTGDNLTADLGTAIDTSEITNSTITQDDIDDSATLGGNPTFPTDSVWFAATGLIFESGNDTIEGNLVSATLSASDKTWTLPNASGTIAVSATSPVVLSSAGAISVGDAAADGTTKGIAAFNSTDFDATSGVISLDGNVVKVGGASILSSQIPTVFAADGVSRCLGDDNDWCAAYNATFNMVLAGGVTLNVGPTPTASPTATATVTPTSTAATATATAATPTPRVTPTYTGGTPTPIASPALLVRGRDPRCRRICSTHQSGGFTANFDWFVSPATGIASATRSQLALPLDQPGYFANLECTHQEDLARGERSQTGLEVMTCTASADGGALTCSATTVLSADCAGTDNVAESVCRGYPLRTAQFGPPYRWDYRMTDYNSAGGLYRQCCVDFCPEP